MVDFSCHKKRKSMVEGPSVESRVNPSCAPTSEVALALGLLFLIPTSEGSQQGTTLSSGGSLQVHRVWCVNSAWSPQLCKRKTWFCCPPRLHQGWAYTNQLDKWLMCKLNSIFILLDNELEWAGKREESQVLHCNAFFHDVMRSQIVIKTLLSEQRAFHFQHTIADHLRCAGLWARCYRCSGDHTDISFVGRTLEY